MAEVALRALPALRTPVEVAASRWFTVLPEASRLILHGGVEARAAVAVAWDASFSLAACRALVDGPRATLWLGPDEYLLLGPVGDSQLANLDALERALGDIPHALVDVSHRQIALQVSGPHATTLLAGACPLDLDLEEFPVGMCTRTVFSKADIVLWRVGQHVFHVEIWRSFTGYVTGLLNEIGREFVSIETE
jgi:sarcosine oxidase, subunit gamma